jgi:tetratricopeptide (TPR) repeat protein
VCQLSRCCHRLRDETAPPPTVSTPHFPDCFLPRLPGSDGATLEGHKAGWQWLQTGDLATAERNFDASLRLTPDFYPAEAGLGYIALARKDHDAALEHFDRAVVANPRYAPALTGRGDALLAAGQRDTALKSFEAAAAADPTLQSLQSRIDVLRLRVLQDDVAAARKAAESGKLADARQAYLQAIAASPQSPFLYRAAAVGSRIKPYPPPSLHARRQVGWIRRMRGRWFDRRILSSGRLCAALELSAARLSGERVSRARIGDLRARRHQPPPARVQSIEAAPTVTRAQLAAVLGLRLDPLFKRMDHTTAVVITDARTSWAAPWIMSVARAGVMEVYANHTFQPSAVVRRADLARAASNVLALIADEKPALGAQWRNAARRRFPDVSQGHLSYSSVSLVVEAGVMTPAEDGSFQLARPATGAEAIAAVRKLEDLANAPAR